MLMMMMAGSAQLGSTSQPGPVMPTTSRAWLMMPYCGLKTQAHTTATAMVEVTAGVK